LPGCSDSVDNAPDADLTAWCERHISSVPGGEILTETFDPSKFDDIIEAAIVEADLQANAPGAVPAEIRAAYSNLGDLWKTMKRRAEDGEPAAAVWTEAEIQKEWLSRTRAVYATPVPGCSTTFSAEVQPFVPIELSGQIGYVPVATTTTP
jgi:hypothetical protein